MPGGFDNRSAVTTFDVYAPTNNVWTTLDPLPFPLSAHSAVTYGDRIFTFGSYDKPDQVSSFNFTKKIWIQIKNSGYKSSRHNASVVYKDRVFIFGGRPNNVEPAIRLVQVLNMSDLEKKAVEAEHWLMNQNEIIKGWVNDLGASNYKKRNEAIQKLSELGLEDLPFLKKAKTHADPEVRLNAKKILDAIK